MAEPKILGVREILSSFRSTLATARQTGEPVVIALRRRKPAGVLLGYETWLALKAQLPTQAETSALRADTRRQVEELSRDLAAARQRVAELEAQLARPPTASQSGEAWGVEPLSAPANGSPETWPSQTWGTAWNAEASVGSGWGQR